MVFSSIPFLIFFLPLVFGAYFVLPRSCRNGTLLIFSLIFYAWGEPRYVVLILLSVTVNYLLALGMDGLRGGWRKGLLITAIVLNVGCLGYFKYFNFVGSLFNRVGRVGLGSVFPQRDIALPIGISFYTFQLLSYMIDVYRGRIAPQGRWDRLALYVAFFPQLIAGPIVQYSDAADQLEKRVTDGGEVAAGLRRFCAGLGKKALIANTLALTADRIYGLPFEQVGSLLTWAAASCYMLQIYFDFSAYSDMAIGLARCFGFRFKENFLYPYTAGSVRMFWRRWHVSLSSWFRDYLYIPLGGNRHGAVRNYLNLFIVFFLTGLWHGAGLHFIFWGLFHGFFSVAERLIPARVRAFLDRPLFRPLGHVYTLLEVMVGWIFFRIPGIRLSAAYTVKLFRWMPEPAWNLGEVMPSQTVFLFCLAVLLSANPRGWLRDRVRLSEGVRSLIANGGALILLLLSLLRLVSNTYNPFIYFRF